MPRQKGTLVNFKADGDISDASLKWLLRSGKIAIGKERTQLIERKQLAAWGVLMEKKPGGT